MSSFILLFRFLVSLRLFIDSSPKLIFWHLIFFRDKDVLHQANDLNSNFSLCTNYHPSERSRLSSVSPKPSLKPKEKGWATPENRNVLFHQKCLFDAKTSTMSFAKPPSLTKAKTLSIESRDCNNESLCATWPPVGKTGTILGELNYFSFYGTPKRCMGHSLGKIHFKFISKIIKIIKFCGQANKDI